MSDEEGYNETLEKARLGIEAQSFLRSSLGQYLLERAKVDDERLMAELRTVKPSEFERIRDIQNELKVIDMFNDYLEEIINSGHLAEQNIREEDAFDD